MGFNLKIYRLAACLKCHGDLACDQGDWICLRCGVYHYTGLRASPRQREDSLIRIATVSPGRPALGQPRSVSLPRW